MAANTFRTEPLTPHAPRPEPPRRQYAFTDAQIANPSGAPPGDRLDAELDRTNQALGEALAWAGVSLNSDGSLRSGAVGAGQLSPDVIDGIAEAGLAELRPMLAEVRSLAVSAMGAAAEADASALAAAKQNELAQQAIGPDLHGPAEDAAASAAEAAESALEAAASATSALDSANHADGAEAICIDYGVLTQAWAEHMPDTIPPDILAVMDVTGDHWSSRWWANRAAQIVEDAALEVTCEIEKLWLGAHATPPTLDSCGNPIVAGAMYYNTVLNVTQVYDGFAWENLVQPVVGSISKFLYLPTVATSIFTGPDHYGNTLALSPLHNVVDVYLNGVKLLDTVDYSWSDTSVTLLLGSITAPNVLEIVAVDESIALAPPPNGVKINTSIWVFDGIAVDFPIHDLIGNIIAPSGAVDCLVSLNGVIQEAGHDFTTSPGFIHFTTPPEADAYKWMVVGVPLGSSTIVAPPGDAPAAARGTTTCEELVPRIDAIEARLAVIERRLNALEAAS